MATTQEKLTLLANTKEAIKNAIIAKGVSVSETDTFASYADKIAQIEGGGGTAGGKTSGEFITDLVGGNTVQDISYLFYKKIIDQDMLDTVFNFENITTATNSFQSATAIDDTVVFKASQTFRLNKATTSAFKTFAGCKIAGDLVIDLNSYNISLNGFVSGASNITSVKMLNSENVATFSSAFSNMSNVEEIEADFSSCANLYCAFMTCLKIKELDFSTLTSACTNFTNAFANCSSLETITNLNINGCTSSLNFGSGVSNLSKLTFQAGETACTTLGVSFTNVIAGGYFQDLVDSLPTNTANGTLMLKATDKDLITEDQKAAIEAKGWVISYG